MKFKDQMFLAFLFFSFLALILVASLMLADDSIRHDTKSVIMKAWGIR
jgi:hypothetical protein